MTEHEKEKAGLPFDLRKRYVEMEDELMDRISEGIAEGAQQKGQTDEPQTNVPETDAVAGEEEKA